LLLSQLLRAPIGSLLVRTDFDGTTLTLGIATTKPYASCPACGHETRRVHSRYTRSLAEEPVFGHRVRLRMTLRRFLCTDAACSRRIFAEPLGGFAARYARTTARLARTHLAIGSALGGEAGARLAGRVAVPASPETLLRRVKQAGPRSSGTPRLVGIDDWAWCKGQRYGTIVVDLKTSDVIDLLPDRDAATVRAWLEAHPGIELVSRDRSSSYSLAATEGAPHARQVGPSSACLSAISPSSRRLSNPPIPIREPR
jgi:transposase